MKLHNPNIPVKIILANILTILPVAYVLSPLRAQAFPCSKASTNVERAICANPEIKQADDAMEKVYFSMRENLGSKSTTPLKTSQRNWLKYRQTCSAEPNCLRAETKSRVEALKTVSRYRPAMVPIFRWQQGSKNAYAIKFEGLKFAYPDTGNQTAGRAAFNSKVDKSMAKAPWGEKTEDQTISSWEQEITLTINRLSRRIISATAITYDYSGGAHPNSWSTSININLQTGRPLTTTELFSKKSIKILTSECRDIIIKAKSNRFNDTIEEARAEIENSYPGAVKTHVLDMTKWRFGDEGVSINFDSYAIGPYAAGPFSCEFSTKYIKQLTRIPEILEN